MRHAIPDHELLRCIGQGAYGEVWLARNVMGTYRAVKLIYKRDFSDDRGYSRELEGVRHFEPVSRSHEGFVDILQVGMDPAGNYFYYIMELADDASGSAAILASTYRPRTLKEELGAGKRTSAGACIELGLALSGALNQLHAAGLVHRDIKPSNIVFVEGRPRLADIGLVTPLDPAGSFVGTEGFVPPEGPNHYASDLYSLGKVLYEMSTGRDRSQFPRLPEEWENSSDHQLLYELNEVVLRACDSNMTARYQSANAMQADLAALLAGKSLRWQRTLERRITRLKRGGIAAALVSLVAVLAYLEFERGRVEQSNLRQRQVGLRLAEETSRVESGDFLGALDPYAEAVRLEPDGAASTLHRVRLASTLAQAPRLARVWSFTNEVTDVAYSPDGSRLAVVLSPGRMLTLHPESGQTLSFTNTQDRFVERVVFSPDSQRLVLTSHNRVLRWFGAQHGELLRELPLDGDPACVAFRPDGRQLACALREKKVLILDANDGRTLKEIPVHAAPLWSVAWSPDGRCIATASEDKTAARWDVGTGHQVGETVNYKSWAYDAQFSPDGKRMVSASFDRSARMWNERTLLSLPMLHKDGVIRVAFSPDGQVVATASLDGTVRLWDGFSAIPLPRNQVLPHGSRMVALGFSPEGRRLVTGCYDGTVRLWELASRAPLPLTQRGTASEDGRQMVDYQGKEVRLLDLPTLSRMQTHLEATRSTTLTHNGRFALIHSNTGSNRWQVWGLRDGKVISLDGPPGASRAKLSEDGLHVAFVLSNEVQSARLPGLSERRRLLFTNEVRNVEWSSDAQSLLVWGGKEAWVWTPWKASSELRLPHPMEVRFARFAPQGGQVVTCEADGVLAPGGVRFWDAATGQQVGPSAMHADGVVWIDFSSDGQKFVTGGEDFAARVWSVRTHRPLTPPMLHANQVKEACFSADGRCLVTVSDNNTVQVWDPELGSPLTPPLVHPQRVEHARFTPQNGEIVTWADDGPVWLWPFFSTLMPVADSLSLAGLVAGGGPVGSKPEVTAGTLQENWTKLQAKYPQAFQATAQDVEAWHIEQASQAEQNGRWTEALLHLDRLVAGQPANEELAQQREKIREKAKVR